MVIMNGPHPTGELAPMALLPNTVNLIVQWAPNPHPRPTPTPIRRRGTHHRPCRRTFARIRGSLGARAFAGRVRLCGPAVGGDAGSDVAGRVGERWPSMRLAHASQPACSSVFAAPLTIGESVATKSHATVLGITCLFKTRFDGSLMPLKSQEEELWSISVTLCWQRFLIA
jgi:hypothetical protein